MACPLSSLLLLSSLISGALTQNWSPPDVKINNIAYGGTGCPQGSVVTVLPVGGNNIVIKFDSFTASAGPDVSIVESRKNCQVNIDLTYPSGVQYSVNSIKYSGYAKLADGASGIHKTTIYYSGSTEQVSTSITFSGPVDDGYAETSEISADSALWSTCNNPLPLNINSQVRVLGSSATGGSLYDTGLFDTSIVWRNCTS